MSQSFVADNASTLLVPELNAGRSLLAAKYLRNHEHLSYWTINTGFHQRHQSFVSAETALICQNGHAVHVHISLMYDATNVHFMASITMGCVCIVLTHKLLILVLQLEPFSLRRADNYSKPHRPTRVSKKVFRSIITGSPNPSITRTHRFRRPLSHARPSCTKYARPNNSKMYEGVSSMSFPANFYSPTWRRLRTLNNQYLKPVEFP